MNNLRLLAGLLCVALLSGGVRVCGQSVMTLEQIFEHAEAGSAQLRTSLSAAGEARRDISVARSQRLPDIEAALSVGYNGDGFTTDRHFADYQKAPIPHFGNAFGITLSQPIYAGGAISAGIELAGLKSTATRYATDLQRDNIRLRLTGLYLDIYKFCNLRTVIENNIVQAHKVLAEMQAKYGQGVALSNDIIRYELLLSGLELNLIQINNSLDILNHNLVLTAGLPADVTVVPDSTILSRSLPSCGEDEWLRQADVNSPSLALARTGVDISRKAEDLARADRLPKVGVQAGWTLNGPILTEVPPINRNLSYWYVALGVSYNISSLFKTNKSLAKSRAATRHAVDCLDAARENLAIDVRADYVRYLEAYEELKTRRKSVELAERNYSTVATRFSAGMALITDMLDAANSRLDAQQQLVNARINIIYLYYKLLFTTGQI